MYPSLVNCTTIDLFADWPQDALLEVGERYLSQIELAGDDKVTIVKIFFFFFQSIDIFFSPLSNLQFATVRDHLITLFSSPVTIFVSCLRTVH